MLDRYMKLCHYTKNSILYYYRARFFCIYKQKFTANCLPYYSSYSAVNFVVTVIDTIIYGHRVYLVTVVNILLLLL